MNLHIDELPSRQAKILQAYSSAWQRYRAKQDWGQYRTLGECDALWLRITEQLLSRNEARPRGNRVMAIKILRESTAETETFVAPCEYTAFAECFREEQQMIPHSQIIEFMKPSFELGASIKLDCTGSARIGLKEAKQIIDSYAAMLTVEIEAREKAATQQLGKDL